MMRAVFLVVVVVAAACAGSAEQANKPVTVLDAAGMKRAVENQGAKQSTRLSYTEAPSVLVYSAPGAFDAALACGQKQGWWTSRERTAPGGGPPDLIMALTDLGGRMFEGSGGQISPSQQKELVVRVRGFGQYAVTGAFVQVNAEDREIKYDAQTVLQRGYTVDTITPLYRTAATYEVGASRASEEAVKVCALNAQVQRFEVPELYVKFARTVGSGSRPAQWLVYDLDQRNVKDLTPPR